MTQRVIASVVLGGGLPQDGVVLNAYKASRFVTPPVEGAAPPASPDAGPVTSGPQFGGEGTFQIVCPTDEAYYVTGVINGDQTWQFYASETGPPGAVGATGATGPPGPPGGSSYTWTQNVPAAVWDVVHNLGRYPSVTVVNSAGDEVEGDIAYISSNELTITFGAAFGGEAYLN